MKTTRTFFVAQMAHLLYRRPAAGGARAGLQVAHRRNGRLPVCATLALTLAAGLSASAQSNRVPGPNDYGQFAQFITERNIFNPSRYAIIPGQQHPIPAPRYAPSFTLCGVMSYEKGMFAFFDGNQPNLRKVLYQSDSNNIAGYVLTNITATNVTLQSADKKETVPLNIGQGMQQAGGGWQLVAQGGYFGGGGGGSYNGGGFERGNPDFGGGRSGDFGGATSGANEPPAANGSNPDSGAAPGPAADGNDVLKRLMQQRQNELK